MSEDDIKSVLYKGNLYWMPKLEANELISEFVNDLVSLQGIGGIPLVYEPLRILIEKWENK